MRGIHWSPMNSPHKGQWRGALMCTLICLRVNGWVNNREAGDLRCHRARYDVIVIICLRILTFEMLRISRDLGSLLQMPPLGQQCECIHVFLILQSPLRMLMARLLYHPQTQWHSKKINLRLRAQANRDRFSFYGWAEFQPIREDATYVASFPIGQSLLRS